MTCATCRRLRKRVAEELAKLKAAIAGPTRKPELERAIAERQTRISRRATLRALLAGVAITTGLARTVLELVEQDEVEALMVAAFEIAWRDGGKPEIMWIREDQLAEIRRHWTA